MHAVLDARHDGSAVSVPRQIPSPLLRNMISSHVDAYGSFASDQLDGHGPAWQRAPLSPPTSHNVAHRLLRRESSQHNKRFDSADHVLEVAEEKLQKARLNLAQMRDKCQTAQSFASQRRDGRGYQLEAAPSEQGTAGRRDA
jgi:hypothetical protein